MVIECELEHEKDFRELLTSSSEQNRTHEIHNCHLFPVLFFGIIFTIPVNSNYTMENDICIFITLSETNTNKIDKINENSLSLYLIAMYKYKYHV